MTWSKALLASAGIESISATGPTSITFSLDWPAPENTVPKMMMKNSGKKIVKNRLIRSRTNPLSMADARALNARSPLLMPRPSPRRRSGWDAS